MFKDRIDAGQRLAETLKKRGVSADIIIALPRGGVEVGRAVADALGLPLDIVVPRKIGAPGNPEYAIGAIAESGEPVGDAELAAADPKWLVKAVAGERALARRRLDVYRKGMPPRVLNGKRVVIVDDGMATGLTMRAAIATTKAEGAAALIVAVPVAPPDTVSRISGETDVVVALETPAFFGAVGEFYEKFPQVEDEEVVRLLKR